jgi:acyl-homoserine-lactone acylase
VASSMRRFTAVTTSAAAVLALAVPTIAGAQDDASDDLLVATITRTSHGIPHIVADDFASLGFGHGYATAEDHLCLLADTIITGRGERSKWFGPNATFTDHVTLRATNLQTDVLFTNIRDRGVVEELLADPDAGPGPEVRDMVRGFIAGANQYLDDIGGPDGIDDPACAGAEWIGPADELDLWHGIYAANLLASAGVFVPEIVGASPPTLDNLGLPLSAPTTGGFAPVPDVLPTSEELREALGKGDNGFGSNGTALGGDATVTGRGMVLGNPHFPWRGRYRFTQAHLTIPGQYNVAGGMLIGSPVVNIGWTDDVAWTHTVSTAYRFTPYEYRSLAYEGMPLHYLTTDGPKELDRQEVKVTVRQADGSLAEVVEDVYRTDQGYVLDAPSVLMGWTPVSFFALREANAEHLRTLDVFHEMAKASNVEELLDAHIRTGGMPWVNTMAADRDGNALYADASVVPNVSNQKVLQCATPIGHVLFQLAGLPALDGTRATADCAWDSDADASRPGIFGRENLPHTIRRDWVINANDSHWLPNPDDRLEGFARIIGCEECERSLRTRMVYRYVMDRLDGSDGMGGPDLFTHDQLQAIQHANRALAAELAVEDDALAQVCEAADGGNACDVLAAYDGTTNVDSAGAVLFREFWRRTPAGRWTEGFDPDRPVETPRGLDADNDAVVDAVRTAIDWVQARVALDASLRDQQVAAYDGAGRISLGGGPGFTGDANVITSSSPVGHTDALYRISYGSSHMQAVAFTDDGVRAATMLTYGQTTDPTRPYFGSQTPLFGAGQWVSFPWTDQEIAADQHASYVVSNGPIPDPEEPVEPGDPERPGRPEVPGPPDDRGRPSEGPGHRPGPGGTPGQAIPAMQATSAAATPAGAAALAIGLLALAGMSVTRARRR